MLATRAWLGLVVLVLAWLGPWSRALAAPGELTVALELEGRPEAPAWVCVASRAKGRAQVDVARAREHLDARGALVSAPSEPAAAEARPSPSTSLRLALEAMAPTAAEPHCGSTSDGGQACAPRVSLVPDEHRFVACAANERRAAAQPRVLWLAVSTRDAAGAPAAVERISLNGTVVTLSTNLRGKEVVAVVQAIGGHSRAEGDVRVGSAGPAVLSLAPRCRWVPVRVPPIQLPTGAQADPRPTFELEHDGHGQAVPAACVRGSLADESLEVRVPYNDPALSSGEHRGMRLRATIDQTVPRERPWRSPAAAAEDDEGGWRARREVVVIQQASAAPSDAPDPDRAPSDEDEGEGEREPAEPFAIDLSARWSGAWPIEVDADGPAQASPAALALVPEVVTFFWPRDACFYAEGCPEARLTSSARACEPHPRQDGCYYRCDVGPVEVGVVGESFRVPITFTDLEHGSPWPEWGATLEHLNQRFLRSVPPEQRRVRVDLGQWSRSFVPAQDGRRNARHPAGLTYGESLDETAPLARRWPSRHVPEIYDGPGPLVDVPGDQIRALSFRGAFGSVHRIELGRGEQREHHFTLPQARCGETVRVDVEGDRQYLPTDVQLRAGTLELPHPQRLARVLYFGTGLSLGLTRVISPRDAARAAAWAPAAAIDLSLRFRLRRLWRAWRFELPRVSYMLATQPYAPIGPTPGQPARVLRRALYSRFLVAALARTPDFPRIDLVPTSLAFGLGLDVGAPLRSSDLDAVGGARVGLVPLAELLVRPTPRVELRLLEPRLHCLEGFHRHTTDLEGQARDDVARARMCTLYVGAGVAGTW